MFTLDGKPETTKYYCQECEQKHVRSTGYVVRGGKAFAVYHAYLHGSSGDDEKPIAVFVVIFANWGKSENELVDAVAFRSAVREGQDDYEFMLQDPTADEANRHDIAYLTRKQALKHARVKDMWDVIDFVVVADPRVHRLLYGHKPKI